VLITHRVALDVELFDGGSGSLVELYRAFGINLVANGDDRGEFVVLGIVTFSVCSSYSEISNN
jgi:hypothetical protein